jgi:hypothetical protein
MKTFSLRGIMVAMALLALAGCADLQQGGTPFLSSLHDFALGRYHSTPEQIRVAQQRASRHYARLSVAKKKKLRENGTRYVAVRTLDPSPDQLSEIRKRAASGGYSPANSGYVGGPNLSGPPPEHKAPEGPFHCVMIWDTYAESLVGNDCFAVTKLPPVGETARFETYTAEYVGTGED